MSLQPSNLTTAPERPNRRYSPSHHDMQPVMHTLNPRSIHSSKECSRVSLEIINQKLNRLGRKCLICPCGLVGVLEWEDEVLDKGLGCVLTSDEMGDWVGADLVCECAVGDDPAGFFGAPEMVSVGGVGCRK